VEKPSHIQTFLRFVYKKKDRDVSFFIGGTVEGTEKRSFIRAEDDVHVTDRRMDRAIREGGGENRSLTLRVSQN